MRIVVAALFVLLGCAQGQEGSRTEMGGDFGQDASGRGGSGGSPSSGGSGGSSRTGAGGGGLVVTSSDLYQSGSRIKMRVGTTPDGAKEFRGWRDTQLNLNCSFQPDPSGVLRCMPSISPASNFADGGCTVPAALSVKGCNLPPPDLLSTGDLCTSSLRLFKPVVATSIFVKTATACVDQTTTYAPTFAFYSVGDAVDPTIYQSMVEDVE